MHYILLVIHILNHSLLHQQQGETTMVKLDGVRYSSQNWSYQHQYSSPQELNIICLYSQYRNNPQSKLKKYLFNKTNVKRSYYMLIEIMKNLKLIVRSEKLFDFKNPSIIMCDSDLEIALNVKDLHVTEIRDQILKQLILVKQQNWFKNYNTYMCKNKDTSISSKKLDTPSKPRS